MTTLIHLRQQIDNIDRSILELLQRRFVLAGETRALKTAVKDPEREQEVSRRWREEAERLGLSPDFAADLFKTVLAESHRIQTKIA